jgi:hypothetical protein
MNRLKKVVPKMKSPMFWCMSVETNMPVAHQKITKPKAKIKVIELPRILVACAVSFSK